MSVLQVNHRDGGWRVSLNHIRASARGAASPELGERVAAFPFDEAAVWRLEFAKTERALGASERAWLSAFCAACVAAPTRIHTLETTNSEAAAKYICAILRCRLPASLSLIGAARFAFAAVVAAALLAGTLFRLITEPRRALRPARAAPAMHGERSTRTRHLMMALARESYAGDLLIVGRPRVSLLALAKDLERLGVEARLVRPCDVQSLITALSRSPAALMQGFNALKTHPSAPRTRELAGAIYRVLFGTACAAWWRRSGPKVQAVVFAHTGVADTTLLEREQQLLGATTVHWAHGLSLGVNFVAHSTLGLFQCAHDAAWHQRLGGYARTAAPRGVTPSFTSTPSQVLLLSNLIHPMNLTYARAGPVSERALLALVAEACRRARLPPGCILWKPHPVFYSEPEHVRSAVTADVLDAGFGLWPSERPLSDMDGVGRVISTPSSAALDSLRLGRSTIIVAVEALPPGSLYQHFSHVVHDSDALADLLRAPPSKRDFLETWNRIGPSAALEWRDVVALSLASAVTPELT